MGVQRIIDLEAGALDHARKRRLDEHGRNHSVSFG